MKALTCEMCGSTNLIKEGGVFVCQSCGTKYSVEEAKKMMVEGTVKVDKSQDTRNLVQLAKDALDGVNGEEAYSYANRALETDPYNAEAWLIKMKAANLKATLGDMKVLDVINAGKKAIELSNKEYEKEVYSFYLTKCLNDLQFFITQLEDDDAIADLYLKKLESDVPYASDETLKCDNVLKMVLNQADMVVSLRTNVPDSLVSNDDDIKHLVEEIAKQWVCYANSVNNRYHAYGMKMKKETVSKYREFLNDIKKGLPQEKQDVIREEAINNSGCMLLLLLALSPILGFITYQVLSA